MRTGRSSVPFLNQGHLPALITRFTSDQKMGVVTVEVMSPFFMAIDVRFYPKMLQPTFFPGSLFHNRFPLQIVFLIIRPLSSFTRVA